MNLEDHQSQQGHPSKQNNAPSGRGLSIAGMVIGICSVVLVWIGFILGILAIIFSSIGLKRSKNGIAIAGLVTGIIGTVIGLFMGAAVIIAAYASISSAAQDSSVRSGAYSVQTQAERFLATYGSYPTFEEMDAVVQGELSGVTIHRQGVSTSGSNESRDIIYIPCYGEGGIIWYWSDAESEYESLYVGRTDSCEWNE